MSAVSSRTDRQKRCLSCSYLLVGLPENRCPECGRTFDPSDPTTFCWADERRNKLWLVFAMYGLALAVDLVLWYCWGEHHGFPWDHRVRTWAISAGGPLIWVALFWNLDWPFIIPSIIAAWGVWAVCIWRWRRLRNLPYILHLIMGLFWCLSGNPPLTLA